MDTGASSHMFGEKGPFNSLQTTPPSGIAVASKTGSIFSRHWGCVTLGSLNLKDVLYSDQLTGNIISIGRLCDDGYTAIFRQKDGFILDKRRRVVVQRTRDPHSDRLWHPNVHLPNHALFTPPSKTDLANLWHRRLGHSHPDTVIKFLKAHEDITLSCKHFVSCDSCTLGKLRQSSSKSSFHRATRVLDLVHSDLIAPIYPASITGFKYILTFIADYTRYNHIYLLKNKSDTFIKFQH